MSAENTQHSLGQQLYYSIISFSNEPEKWAPWEHLNPDEHDAYTQMAEHVESLLRDSQNRIAFLEAEEARAAAHEESAKKAYIEQNP